jgi:UDP-galactose transporter B1
MGLLQVLGQMSIYYVIVHFKQHMFPLISTTRKMISMLVSIFLFNHKITDWQWVAIGIVFFGMFYELYE